MIFPWIAEEIDDNVWLYCCWLLDTECTFLQESCDCYPDSWEKGKVSNTWAKGGISWTPSYELLLPGEWEVRKAWSAIILRFYFVSSTSWGCKKRLQQWRMLIKTSHEASRVQTHLLWCVLIILTQQKTQIHEDMHWSEDWVWLLHDDDDDDGRVLVGKLFLVDLAGSERLKRSGGLSSILQNFLVDR